MLPYSVPPFPCTFSSARPQRRLPRRHARGNAPLSDPPRSLPLVGKGEGATGNVAETSRASTRWCVGRRQTDPNHYSRGMCPLDTCANLHGTTQNTKVSGVHRGSEQVRQRRPLPSEPSERVGGCPRREGGSGVGPRAPSVAINRSDLPSYSSDNRAALTPQDFA